MAFRRRHAAPPAAARSVVDPATGRADVIADDTTARRDAAVPPPTTPATAPPAAAPPTAPAGPRYAPEGPAGPAGDGSHEWWEARTRIFLQPIAGPSIIGLFGFMGATLMVGAWQAGWYGGPATPAIIFPFAFMFGGLMQGGAAFSSLKARDGLAAAVHATWGAFWLGWGLLWGLTAAGILPAVPLAVANPSMAFWFVVLCAITAMMALVATFRDFGIAGVLWTLAAGSGLTAAGMWGGYLDVTKAGGVLFVISAGIAWYVATAMVFENAIGRTILPIFKPRKAAVIPGHRATVPIQYPEGMPGVRVGQ